MLQAASGVAKVRLRRPAFRSHGRVGRVVFALLAGAAVTGAAHVGSSSLVLDLGIYAACAATFAVLAVFDAAKLPPSDAPPPPTAA